MNNSPNTNKKIPSHHSDSRYMKSGGKNENDGMVSINEKGLGDLFGEAEDYKIQEKYTKELLHKYKFSTLFIEYSSSA